MTIIIGIIALSFIVFFHELGHFVFAKLFGVKVLSFSIGMGPILFHKTINDTDYRISLLPFGGYCGMEGENDFKKAIEENLTSFPKNKTSLYGVHPIKRALIAFAGPFFNFLLAIIAFTIINITGYEYFTLSNKILIPEDLTIESPARNAGIKSGDKIIQINNQKVETFNDIYEIVSIRPKELLTIKVIRNQSNIDTELIFEVKTLINEKQGNGILGIIGDNSTYQKTHTKTYSFFPALYHGTIQMFEMCQKTIKSLGILFKGIDITSAVSGPARVTSILGDAVSNGFKVGFNEGLCSTLELISLISISLGIMNLLPIPILDGGIILFALITFIFKKEISPKTQYKIQLIGIVFIAILFVIGTTGDIRYFIEKWRQK